MCSLTRFFTATTAALLPATTTSVMKTTRLLKMSLATFAVLLCSVTQSPAQILYSQLAATNPDRFQLRQVNGDGSGDTPIALPFADVRFPVWSRDGGVIRHVCAQSESPERPQLQRVCA